MVAPINHDAILILAREYSRGYSSLSSHSILIDEFCMFWLPRATHRKVRHKMVVWTATRAGWPSKQPLCAILFYALPRVTKECETRLQAHCVEAAKNKAETYCLLDAIGHRSCGRSGLGIKIDVWENPVVYASTRDWSSLYGMMSSQSETAAQSSCSDFECLWDLSGCLSSACIAVCAVNFTVTPAENFVSSFSESSPSPRKN